MTTSTRHDGRLKGATTCLPHQPRDTLRRRLGLHPVRHVIMRHQLTWLGHVARMSSDRAPRQFLTAWITRRRPQGARPLHAYAIATVLHTAGIAPGSWMRLAQDRATWRRLARSWAKKRAPTQRRSHTSSPSDGFVENGCGGSQHNRLAQRVPCRPLLVGRTFQIRQTHGCQRRHREGQCQHHLHLKKT